MPRRPAPLYVDGLSTWRGTALASKQLLVAGTSREEQKVSNRETREARVILGGNNNTTVYCLFKK